MVGAAAAVATGGAPADNPRSTTMTSTPPRASHQPALRPVAPAPMTTTEAPAVYRVAHSLATSSSRGRPAAVYCAGKSQNGRYCAGMPNQVSQCCAIAADFRRPRRPGSSASAAPARGGDGGGCRRNAAPKPKRAAPHLFAAAAALAGAHPRAGQALDLIGVGWRRAEQAARCRGIAAGRRPCDSGQFL